MSRKMLNAEQFKLRAQLEKNIEKACQLLNYYSENANSRKTKKYSSFKDLLYRLHKCHIRVTADDLHNEVILNEINRTLACASSWLGSSNYQTPRQKSKVDQPEKTLHSSGDASGLYAFRFGTLHTFNEKLLPLFQSADQVENESLKMTPIRKKFYFSDRNEATQFKETALRFGMHFVIEHDYERYCLNRRDDTTSQSMTALTFYVIPLGSYKLYKNKLFFNEISLAKVREINCIEKAEEFLDHFGSHVALDWNQVGGILCQSIEIAASQPLSVAVLERYADEIINDKFTDLKFQPIGLHEILLNSEEGVQLECHYCANTLGPLVAQPRLFEQLLEVNPFNLLTIDRDFSSLVGIWEILEERHAALKSQADHLRKAWLEKAGQGSVVEREIKKVEAALQARASKQLPSATNGSHVKSANNSPIYATVSKKKQKSPAQVHKSTSEEILKAVAVQPETLLPSLEPMSQTSSAYHRRKSSIVAVEVHKVPVVIEEHRDKPGETSTEEIISTRDPLVLAAQQSIPSVQQFHSSRDERNYPIDEQVPPSEVAQTNFKDLVIVSRSVEPIYAEIVLIPESESKEKCPNELPENLPMTRTKEHIDVINEFQRVNEAIDLPSSTKKPYNYFIADRALSLEDPRERLLMSIRRREDLNLGRRRGKSLGIDSTHSPLFEMLSELDVPSIRECFVMLFENKFLIPLFNPLTQESYLELIKDITVQTNSNSVVLGSNMNLSRVAIISSRTETQAPELISSLFDVKTPYEKTASPSSKLAIYFGIGHLKEAGSSNNQCFLLSYIVGDFKDSIDYIRDFADYLIVEDTFDEETSIYHWVEQYWKGKQKRNRSPFADIPHVTFWNSTEEGPLRWTAPKDNFHIYGPDPLIVEAPLSDQLTSLLARISKLTVSKDIEEKSYKPASNRKCLQEISVIKDLIPLRMINSDIINCYMKTVNVRTNLPLQRICRRELKRQSRDSPEFYLKELDEELSFNATISINIPLVDIYLKSLQIKDSSQRIFVLRLIEETLYLKTEEELHLLSEEITLLFKSYVDSLCLVKKPTDTAFALRKYIEAKGNYKHAALYVGHIWREISLVYFIKPYAFTHLPALGAQHLLDGFKLEFLNNNSVNLNWLHAVLFDVGKRIQEEQQRFFVVSCCGQQGSNKPSLLEKLFGLPKRTDGSEHYTSGVYVQIIPVFDRDEYDYILLLDAENTWPPTRYEAIQALQFNYQIAAMCSLTSDVNIIVNPKDEEILEIEAVRKTSEEHSTSDAEKMSRFFSVFNWTGENLNTENLILRERFEAGEQQTIRDYEIQCMGNFREIIHQRVCGPHWTSRNISEIEKQLTDTWTRASSVDFGLLCQEAGDQQFETINYSFLSTSHI